METLATILALACPLLGQEATEDDYREYGHYDVRKCLQATEGPDGEPRYSIDLRYAERILADLWEHARDYPPTFASEEERARAVRDARALETVLDLTIELEDADPDDLLRAGKLFSVAHNLGIAGASANAIDAYERLLEKEPRHAEGHFHYGAFLAGTAALTERAVPHLEKAIELGVADAEYTLGHAHLVLGRSEEALRHFHAYLARHPDHAATREMIEAVETGRFEIVRD